MGTSQKQTNEKKMKRIVWFYLFIYLLSVISINLQLCKHDKSVIQIIRNIEGEKNKKKTTQIKQYPN